MRARPRRSWHGSWEENRNVLLFQRRGHASREQSGRHRLRRRRLRLPDVVLYTYCSIREDAFDIYGFSTREELRNFELLLGVTGVGAKAALAILSSTTPDRFALAIFSQDEKALTAAPGVGKKLAQRILLELKDKLGGAAPAEGGISLPAGDVPAASGSALALAQAALAELGYRPQEITAALRSFDPEGMKTEEIVRQCLRAMVMR